MFPPITYFLSDTLIERKRALPGPAKILVRRGQWVDATESVVEDAVGPVHLWLDLTRGLRLPAERVASLVRCKVDALVQEGDILAGPTGLARRVIRAPRNGRVVYVADGQIVLELAGNSKQLKAGFPGEVVDLIPDRGVSVRCTGALIQGMWGNGKIGQGKLILWAGEPGSEMTVDALGACQPGSILVGNYGSDVRLIESAEATGLHGLVFASLPAGLVTVARSAQIPILLVEGFGRHELNPVARQVLAAHTGMQASINAEPWDALAGNRPELVIAKPESQSTGKQLSTNMLMPGAIVRAIGPSLPGRVGRLVDLIGEIGLPNGLRVPAAAVVFEGDEQLNIPLVNLELLG